LNDGGLDLVPDPSNRAGDALDGQVLIVRRLPPLPPVNRLDTLNQVTAVLVKQSVAPPALNPPADPAPLNRPNLVEPVQQGLINPRVPARVIGAIATALAEQSAVPVLDNPLSPANTPLSNGLPTANGNK